MDNQQYVTRMEYDLLKEVHIDKIIEMENVVKGIENVFKDKINELEKIVKEISNYVIQIRDHNNKLVSSLDNMYKLIEDIKSNKDADEYINSYK